MRKDKIKINSRMCVCKRKEGNEEKRIEYIEKYLWKDEKVRKREIKEEYSSIKSVIVSFLYLKPCF